MGSKRTKKLTLLERLILDDVKLQPLVEKFGANAVWQASIDVLGIPPTWMLSTNELLTISNYLTKEK